jgi:two-component system cell cycle sensor histidine kinase/response regulator CckA
MNEEATPSASTRSTGLSVGDSAQLMRAVFDGALDAMLLADDSGGYVDANPAACALFGLGRERLIGRNVREFAESQADVADAWRQFLEAGRAEGHFRLLLSGGVRRDVHYRATANILPSLHLSILRDLTEQQLAESRFQALIEKSSDVVLLCRADSRVEYVSPSITAVLGYQAAELLGTDLKQLIHPSEAHALAPSWASLLTSPSGKISTQWRARHRDGSWRWVESSVRNLLQDPAVRGLICNVRDVSERKQADELAARLAAIVESSDDAILSTNLGGQITSWNAGAERLYCWPASDALAEQLTALIPPELAGFEAGVLERVLRGELVDHYDSRRLRKDGSMVEVAVTVSSTRDATGEISGVAQIARDLTEHRKAELSGRQAEEQLRQAQKMEALGALAGGVAHDFNNLLSIVLTYTILAMEDLEPDSPLCSDLTEVRQAAERATELTHQLLALGRRQVLQSRVLDLSQVVFGMEKTLRRLISEDIELSLLESPTLARVFADPSQLEQIIMNLVVNACEAMPRAGKLTIQTANVELDADTARAFDVAPGPYTTLAISDTGSGMDAGLLARIYEPFFTTKAKSARTGLGLSIVFGIVKQSQGHIGVWSVPGQGTTFRVYFPRPDRALDVASVRAPPASLNGSETVLLVEDEAGVRRATGAILRRHGYEVLDAQNGGEALLICEKSSAPIRLLLTDVVMPHMSGRELADRLAPLRPKMRVLYMSGYIENAIAHHGVVDAGLAFLPKPIVPELLLRKVRQVLDAAPREAVPLST